MFGHTFSCGSLVHFCFLNLSYAFLRYNGKEVLAGVFKKLLLERRSLLLIIILRIHPFSLFSLTSPKLLSVFAVLEAFNAVSKDMADQMPHGFDYFNCFLPFGLVLNLDSEFGILTVIQMLTLKSS